MPEVPPSAVSPWLPSSAPNKTNSSTGKAKVKNAAPMLRQKTFCS
jgi:hypothetical protein